MSESNTTLKQAIALHQQGQLVSAKMMCEQLLITQPDNADAVHLLGIIEYQSNNRERAVQLFSQAIAIDPTRADFCLHCGNVLYELKNFEQAVASYDQSIAINPNDAVIYLNRGLALAELNRWEEAVDSYQCAINIRSDFAESYFNLGNVLCELGRLEKAVESFEYAVAIKPDYADAYFNGGNVLLDLMQLEKAVAYFDRAISINPNYAKAYFNRGCVLLKLKQLENAVDSFDRAIEITPHDAAIFVNRGLALAELKKWEEAINSYDRAMAIKPDFAEAYRNKAVVLLATNHLKQGWELYEWRLKAEKEDAVKITHEWNGQKRIGSLLVLPEQGMGDEIFYSNMLHDLHAKANRITVCVDPRLIPLYQRSFEHIEFFSRQFPPPVNNGDAQIYMGSLGRFFRANPQELQNIKSPYLKACPEKTQELRMRLQNKKLRCGLSWISTNADFGFEKTLRLQDLTSILKLSGIDFIDLQYGDTNNEQADFFNETGIKLTRVLEIDNFHDIDGLASLIDACDIVLTISNTTAHLAAALGKKVIVMLPFARGLLWYWHEEDEKTPWYPTATLVRQSPGGDWASVMERVKKLLEKEL